MESQSTVQRIEPPDKLNELEQRVTSINEELPVDTVLAISEAVDAAYERLKAIRKLRDEAMIEYLQEHGDIEVGEQLLTAGKEKKVKCRDLAATFLAVADAAGGDVDAISDVLASGAWKYGAARTLLGDEQFNELFETSYDDKVKYRKINQRFLKKGTAKP